MASQDEFAALKQRVQAAADKGQGAFNRLPQACGLVREGDGGQCTAVLSGEGPAALLPLLDTTSPLHVRGWASRASAAAVRELLGDTDSLAALKPIMTQHAWLDAHMQCGANISDSSDGVPDPATLVSTSCFLPSTLTASDYIDVEDDPHTEKPSAFVEVTSQAPASVSATGAGKDASVQAPLSLRRDVNADADFTRGSNSSKPFLPGGWGKLASNAHDKEATQNPMSVSELLSKLDASATLFDTRLTTCDVFAGNPDLTDDMTALELGRGTEVLELGSGTAGDQASATTKAAAAPASIDLSSIMDAGVLQALSGAASEGREYEADADQAAGTAATDDKDSSKDGAEQAEEDGTLDSALEEATTPNDASKSTAPAERQAWARVVDVSHRVTDFEKQVPNPAYTWPFELDTFQKQAVIRMEQHESVFIAAHTSAGKTVVAEYAIALCQKHMTKCIYTSPIKALSNQKFRDFRERFEDVGLLTGDVQIKPEASCLVMTTEILRSMLYRGADLIRDVEWVIFDEVHYVNDADRGVVWEEVIIMLPQHIGIVMLSATVPNTFEFADWVGRTKRKVVHVISTQKRPVPLEHYLYTGADKKTSRQLFKLVDSSGNLLMDGYKTAMTAKKERESKVDKSFGARNRQHGKPGSDKTLYNALVNFLKEEELQPTVVFTFSKKRCEQNADALSSKDLTTSKEKSEVEVFVRGVVARLHSVDRKLPQVLRMSEMLRRGIGVHHGGLLPLIKEMVEMLFSRGLVKVLFATETFAMGVNMPTRCVVFDSIRKHDGENFRDLLPGEYVQMAGRAGRRGLDKTGTVIILVKGDVPELLSLKTMMLGTPTVLASRFRLTYAMILSLLRVEELRVEDMMKRSFSEFHTRKNALDSEDALEEQQQQLERLGAKASECPYREELEEYYSLSSRVVALAHTVQEALLNSPNAVKVLSPGRVVVLNSPSCRNCVAIVLRRELARTGNAPVTFTMLVLRGSAHEGLPDNVPLPPTFLNLPTTAEKENFTVEPISGSDVLIVSTLKLKFSPLTVVDRPEAQAQQELASRLLDTVQAQPNGLERVASSDVSIRDLTAAEAYTNLYKLEAQLRSLNCRAYPQFEAFYAALHQERTLHEKVERLKFQLSDRSLHLLPDYHQRVRVLQELGYVDPDLTVKLKGRVACEISTCNELLVTELVFNNALTPLQPEEIVALLSCLVFQEKRCSPPTLTHQLATCVDMIKATATHIAEVQLQCGMDTPVDVYVEELRFGLVEVVYEWARGMPFAQITNLTDVLEGSIVRCIVRLDETCRDVRNAARVIGDPVLYQKMEEASKLIKRDIVFAASLYTQ